MLQKALLEESVEKLAEGAQRPDPSLMELINRVVEGPEVTKDREAEQLQGCGSEVLIQENSR